MTRTSPISQNLRTQLYHWLVQYWAGGSYLRFFFAVLAAVLLMVLLFAAAFRLLAGDVPVRDCLERSFVAFVTLSEVTGLCEGRPVWADDLIEGVQLLSALFFFAAVVAWFTALLVRPKRLLHFKPDLNILHDGKGPDRLACSFYAAPVTVTGLQARIVARVRVHSLTLRNLVLRDGPLGHPFAEPYIPLRIFVPLAEHGIQVAAVDEAGRVGRLLYTDPRSGRLLEVEALHVDIRGTLAQVDQGVFGERHYRIADGEVFFGPYRQVEPDYEYARHPSAWVRRRPPPGLCEAFPFNGEPGRLEEGGTWVFGYGSLVDPASLARTLGREEWVTEDFPWVCLEGYRRTWGVAMDNRRAIPGYKRYRGEDGSWPEVFVAFLDIEPAPGEQVWGVLARVTEDELHRLQRRERNYRLEAVGEHIVNRPPGAQVFAFVGLPEARERLAQGRRDGSAVIGRDYAQAVEAAFRRRGRAAWAHYRDHTHGGDDLPRLVLRRESVPG